jgi:hypothetical protein
VSSVVDGGGEEEGGGVRSCAKAGEAVRASERSESEVMVFTDGMKLP